MTYENAKTRRKFCFERPNYQLTDKFISLGAILRVNRSKKGDKSTFTLVYYLKTPLFTDLKTIQGYKSYVKRPVFFNFVHHAPPSTTTKKIFFPFHWTKKQVRKPKHSDIQTSIVYSTTIKLACNWDMAAAPAPAKNQGKAKQHVTGARFRQRKISVKQPLTIYKQRDLPTLDSNELEPSQVHHLNSNASSTQQPRDIHAVETGVDKNEEEEVHLQQVINAAQKALLGSQKEEKTSDMYIPTPDASRIWPEAHKYYKDQKFKQPETYIKFSATVEDTVGVQYNMDEIDEKFYRETLCKYYPKKKNKSEENNRKCTELEFETICDKLEKTIEARQPFLSMDPTNILSYEELSSYIVDQFKSAVKTSNPYIVTNGGNLEYISTTALKERLSKEIKYEPFVTIFDKNQVSTTAVRPIPKLFELFGRPIYDHWKERKIERKGKTIQPTLKFEDPNSNEKENDNDPYICFRRREFRQARKTRRADTIGAERIRLMQKSLHRARDLIMSVSEREILKLENFQSEHELFKVRCNTKACKRELNIKGDDYLFFPHKKKKVVRTSEDEEREKKKREKKKQDHELAVKQLQALQQQATPQQPPQPPQKQDGTSTGQPYVKLPPAKVPDMDLVTVSLVLKEKNETIKRAVLEKLRKRKEHDKGFINLTDDPYQPFFDISTNRAEELSHIPYSSIAATHYHQFNTSNYLNDQLKKLFEEKKPLPGVKTFLGFNGELVPSKAFPHLLSLLEEKYKSTSGYIERLLHSVETQDFSSYTNGFKDVEPKEANDPGMAFPQRIRRRVGRAGRVFLDHQHQHPQSKSLSESPDSDRVGTIPDIYCKEDAIKRLQSKWKFDTEYKTTDPFSLDPSKLNGISPSTQSIRFGSMLLNRTRK